MAEGLPTGQSLEARFAAYGEVIGTALAHADRQTPAQWYLKGLRLSGGRTTRPLL